MSTTRISSGTAYLDTNNDSGLTTGSTYYYVVAYVDAYGDASPRSAETAVTTVAAAGTWSVAATPTSTTSTPVTATNAYSSSAANFTTATASAASAGPVSTDTPETATSACSGPWTATWIPNTAGAYPGLYVIDEDASQSVSVEVSGTGTGSASASIGSGLSLSSDPLASAEALAGSPVLTDTIDTSTAGLINFGYDNTNHSLILAQSGTTTIAYVERQSDTLRTVHVYTPAYFAQNFAAGVQIVINLASPSPSVTATADAPPGTTSGVGWAASALAGDTFSSYIPGEN
jgi:hypothetical protein